MLSRSKKNQASEKIRKQVFPLMSMCDKIEDWSEEYNS